MTELAPRPARVLDAIAETGDVVTLVLETPASRALRPGQFNMLYAFAVGEVPISSSGIPSHPGVAVHTIRAVGAVSRALCAARPGDTIGVRGPYGEPWPLDALAGRDLVVVAGGLGLAPLRPVVHHALSHHGARSIAVLIGARSPAELLYPSELADWERGGANVRVTVDHADASWSGRVGVVTAQLAGLELGANTLALVCGPEVMMRFAVRELARRGVPNTAIYLSMERNMKCAIGHCGRCQLGPSFVCKDGPVLRRDRLGPWLWTREA